MLASHRRSALVLLVAALLLLTPAAIYALTIHVDHAGGGDYLTIQEGIDTASYGDTVLVAPGTYYEHLYMGTTADGITLLGEAGADSTVIDGEGTPGMSVISCENVGPDTNVEGFTITGGVSGSWGGGIRAYYADIRVSSCTITNCSATPRHGGGIGGKYSVIEVRDCRIEGNRAGEGGGIGILYGSAVIEGNHIGGNEVSSFTASQTGGGIFTSCYYAEITDNVIEANTALYGGGIQDWWSGEVTIADNSIIGNSAAYHGGGIALYHSVCLATGNIIADNHAITWGGGALDVRADDYIVLPEPPQFLDNVFFGNTSGGNESAIRIRFAGPVPVFHANFFADNATYEVEVLQTPSADTIDFTGNWWGTDDPEEIALKIRDCNDDPGLLWCVDFSDWCTDASCDGQVTSVEDPPEAFPVSWGRIKNLYR